MKAARRRDCGDVQGEPRLGPPVDSRRRETGSIAPRKPTKFRTRVLAGQEDRLAALIAARPDATLAELRDGLATTAALSTVWLEADRLGLTVKKNSTRGRTASS